MRGFSANDGTLGCRKPENTRKIGYLVDDGRQINSTLEKITGLKNQPYPFKGESRNEFMGKVRLCMAAIESTNKN